MGKKHTLSIPGRYAEVKRICQFVSQGAASAGLGDRAIFQIELACDEASTNIIEHAYGAEDHGDIEISWHVADNYFIVTIRDTGHRFNPDAVPTPSILENKPQLEAVDDIQVGGLGIHFMRKLMDEVTYSYDPKSGNKLIMKKQIIPDEKTG